MSIRILSATALGVVATMFFVPLAARAILYAPGETLNPACAPTDANCGVTNSTGSGTVSPGTTGQVPYYAVGGDILTATSSLTILQNGNIGIGNPDGTIGLEIRAGGTGLNNTFVGFGTGRANTTGNSNTALGVSLQSNTTGTSNTAIGTVALNLNVTGSNNTALGANTLQNNTTGIRNTGVGQSAQLFNSIGSENTSIGYRSLRNSSGTGNTAIGSQALLNNSTGNNNTTLGFSSGLNLTTGSNNIIIGFNINATSSTATNSLNIGNLIFGTGIDGQVLNISSGNIGIGTTTPSQKLDVNGTINIEGSTNGIIMHDSATANCYLVQVTNGVLSIGTPRACQ